MMLLEHRMKVFGDRVLRSVFKLRRKELMELWREQHNGELQMLCCSPKIISMYKPWKARSDTYGV
jgi:hypothetical protein